MLLVTVSFSKHCIPKRVQSRPSLASSLGSGDGSSFSTSHPPPGFLGFLEAQFFPHSIPRVLACFCATDLFGYMVNFLASLLRIIFSNA
jgi:hypothetical protein